MEVGLPECTDVGVPAGCGDPLYAEAIFGYVAPSTGVGVTSPTTQECAVYAAGTALEVNPVFYKLTGANVIQNTTPGGFLFMTQVTVGALPAGTYIIRLKISGTSVVGKPAPIPSTSQYIWVAELNGVAVPGTQNSPPMDFVKQ